MRRLAPGCCSLLVLYAQTFLLCHSSYNIIPQYEDTLVLGGDCSIFTLINTSFSYGKELLVRVCKWKQVMRGERDMMYFSASGGQHRIYFSNLLLSTDLIFLCLKCIFLVDSICLHFIFMQYDNFPPPIVVSGLFIFNIIIDMTEIWSTAFLYSLLFAPYVVFAPFLFGWINNFWNFIWNVLLNF